MDTQQAYKLKRQRFFLWLRVTALVVGLGAAALLALLGWPLALLVPMAFIPAILVISFGAGFLFVWDMRQNR